MSEQSNVVDLVPFEHRAIGADEAGVIFGCDGRTFLRKWACLPGFPVRINSRPAKWNAGDLVTWFARWRRIEQRRAA